MKNILIFNLIIVLIFSCGSIEKKQDQEINILYDIIFADGFDSDEIEFTVNQNSIVRKILDSDQSVGLTSIQYQIIEKQNNTILINKNLSEEEHIIDINQELELSVNLDENWYSFKPKKDLGRYILIDSRDSIIFTQQKRKPIFD